MNKVFNSQRSSTYWNSPFDSLKEKAKEISVYDRQELGWIALWCLIIGGPALFWYLSRNDLEKNNEVIDTIVDERTSDKRKRLDEKNDKLNSIIAANTAALNVKIEDLERVKSALVAENRLLKAKLEFSPDRPKPPESPKTNGVLDQDIF